jgi:hypothetical protein
MVRELPYPTVMGLEPSQARKLLMDKIKVERLEGFLHANVDAGELSVLGVPTSQLSRKGLEDCLKYVAVKHAALLDGEPCSHRGCLNHISHPCEGCGRIGGRRSNMPFKTTPEDIDHMFKYHPPKPDQVGRYEELREEARKFAQTILRLTPGCPDQTVAIRKVREAVMTANDAIALEKE